MSEFIDIYDNEPTPIVAIGVGNRMRKYLTYVKEHPERVKLVAIAEPDPIRRKAIAAKFEIPEDRCFANYEELFDSGIKAEAAFICTPENDHFKPCMQSLDKGWHVLLEKPAAQSLEHIYAISEKAHQVGKEVFVCHILRYHPCFMKIKELIASGKYGRIISINHVEGVGLDRMCHSYVRGTMNSEKNNNPILLAKCCHDIDLLLWLSPANCVKVSSFGSLLWFKSENAPEGSAQRCIDCKIEEKCPYSAIDLYWRRKEWIANFDIPDGKTLEDVIRKELKEGRFGRCVFHCDNDVADNQIVTMLMDDGSTITLHMDIFSQTDGRTINIKMTEGEIFSDGTEIRATHFATRESSTFQYASLDKNPFHGGADLRIVEQFLNTIRNEGKEKASTTIDEAIKVNLICNEADESRRKGEIRNLPAI